MPTLAFKTRTTPCKHVIDILIRKELTENLRRNITKVSSTRDYRVKPSYTYDVMQAMMSQLIYIIEK